jgi:hypothetical protein
MTRIGRAIDGADTGARHGVRICGGWYRIDDKFVEEKNADAKGGLEHTQVSDAGLVHLKGLTGLKYLRLSHTKITGTGLLHLKCLGNLQVLDVSNSPATDAGLEHLKGLTELGEFDLCGTKVKDAGVDKLQQALPGLGIIR